MKNAYILTVVGFLGMTIGLGLLVAINEDSYPNQYSHQNQPIPNNTEEHKADNGPSPELLALSTELNTKSPKTTTTPSIADQKPTSSTPSPKTTTPQPTTNPKVAINNTPVKINNKVDKKMPETMVSTTPKKIITKLSWGVYTGSNPNDISNFENKVGINPDYLAYFIHWGNGPNHQGVLLPNWLEGVVADKGRTLVLFWEASDYTGHTTIQPDYSHRAILRGDWDEYLEDFATNLKNYNGQVILVPFSELNGNWNPWSGTTNGNTPEEVVASYRYVHKFFDDVPNVKFGIAFNAASVPNTEANQIERYYPGDEYVDYVGVDGFNYNDPWLTASEVFTSALNRITKFGKPMIVFSFGSSEGSQKPAWLNEALNEVFPQYPLLRGWVYFNQNKERNWLLWSDNNTFKVFKDYITK
ncbi:hypothetical protein KC845_03490 [Candidatus Kaiserbacteria bacterium]|nr:hypothetical protein [Candidatus Kaiserbacteria bacterium]